MSIEKRYTCRQCGAVRREANHWFVMGMHSKLVTLLTWDDAVKWQRLDLPWMFPFCGQGCVQKAIEIWMDKKKKA